MRVSLIGEHLITLILNTFYTAYNKHFAYYSVVEKSVRFGVNIKGIASKLPPPFL